jgi:hypothetical protein
MVGFPATVDDEPMILLAVKRLSYPVEGGCPQM